MKKSEALKLLSHDISGIELPPISDKVRQAVRRRNESNETYKFYSQPEHIHKALQLKYIFAAMLLILLRRSGKTTPLTAPCSRKAVTAAVRSEAISMIRASSFIQCLSPR